MISIRTILTAALASVLLLATAGWTLAQSSAPQDGIRAIMRKTADWQLKQLGAKAPVDWQHGAFYAGVMALADASPDPKYQAAMISVGEKNQWRLGPRPFHADDHCVGQTYLELYSLSKDPKMIQPTRASMDELAKHLAAEDKLTWDWCDALFMAPATLAELSAATGDRKYLDAMDKEWWKTRDALYDKTENLFYRDSRFLTQHTKNGRKVFWSRGNGWVLAGLARVLQCMPADYPTRPRYVEQFRAMAKKIASLQGKDGFWRPSLLDPDEIPIGETSGTGFFCYGIAWGIDHGLLDATEYRPVVDKAWKALVDSVNPEGRLGFVQPVGDRPAQFDAESTQPYGVGAFLLAGSEICRLLKPAASVPDTAKPSGALDQVIRQFREYTLAQSSADVKKALDLAASLREDGSWAAVDYKSKQRAAWSTGAHVSHVLTMTCALASGKASPEQSATLESAIHGALSYWRRGDFQCPNWWYNQIGGPQKMGAIALLLGDRLKPEEFDYITGTVMPRAKIARTGQNRVWLAGNTLMDALLLRDEPKAAHAVSVIFSEVVVTENEGIQPDYSFHQHGPQLQFGNYGLAFADDQLKWAAILRGTSWAMSANRLGILRRYLLDGQNWVVWRGAMDISSCGRQLSSGSPKGKGAAVSRLMTRMAALDPVHSAEYAACVKRNQPGAVNDLVGCRFFWRSDYLVNRRKDFAITLKMCSKRVIGSESLNSENLSGYYLADGATYLYRAGDEYENIFPVWNWRKIPGVTCAQGEGPMPSFGSYRIDSDFVGGVSDGANACAVLDYRRDGVSAKKAWFFAGDQAVCLGAGIRSDKTVTAPIATTINQCRLRGDVRISDAKGESVLTKGTHHYAGDLKWVEHDGLRYTFPQPGNITVSNYAQTGNWSKIVKTSETPRQDVSEDVFALFIEHGSNPAAGFYAYCISPSQSRAAAPEVLANTEQFQAVRSGKITEAVFHAAGSLVYGPGHNLTVDAPCVVVLDASGKEPRLTLADPTHSLKSLVVTVDGARHEVLFSGGADAGRSVTVDLIGS